MCTEGYVQRLDKIIRTHIVVGVCVEYSTVKNDTWTSKASPWPAPNLSDAFLFSS